MKHLLFKSGLAALLVLFTAAGCCPCRSYQRRTQRPLVGTEWQLIQLGGRHFQPEEGRYTLRFLEEERRVTGVGACNQLTESYTLGERRALSISPLASTRMACPDGADEAAFAEAIESTTHYEMDGPMLLLLSNGDLKAVFQAKPAKSE